MITTGLKSNYEVFSKWGKRSVISTITFMVLLLLLHFIKPELDPSWRMISEYAIGNLGWLMSLAFLAWAAAFIALCMALRSHIHNLIGKIGLVLLLISALGLVLAGLFTTDPVTQVSEPTTSGTLHSIGGTLGMGMPFSALFLCISLVKNPAWKAKKRTIVTATVIAWTGFLLAMGMMGVLLSGSKGVFSPETPVGIPNRFEVLCYCIWLIVMSRISSRLQTYAQ
jgi:hypothetical membrane protein